MKKHLLLFILLAGLLFSGCGDKFAKDKETIMKSEQDAMAIQLPDLSNPPMVTASKKPTQEEIENYKKRYNAFFETEDRILAEMKKTDAKIAEMEKNANDSEKEELKKFKEMVRRERINFVKKISPRCKMKLQ